MRCEGFCIALLSMVYNSFMRFNKAQKTVTCITDAPVMPIRKYEYPIGSIQAHEIETYDWSEGSPSYSFKIEMMNGREFKTVSSWSLTEIEEIKDRVTLLLDQLQ